MPTSIREQVLVAITAAVDGEYGVPAPESERDLPLTIVQDGTDAVLATVYGDTNVEMPLVVARAAVATSSNGDSMRAQANDLLASVITDMFADETFGGLADGIEYNAGGIQAEVGKFVFVEAQFTVRYHFTRGDPYTSE